MVEVPSGDHTITCTRLALLDGSHIFLRTKWFNTSFYVTAMDFPCSWSCHVATHEIEDRASMLGISCEDFVSQARLYLGDGISDSQYSFEAPGQRPNIVRLAWTIVDMRYTKQPRVTLFLQEDNSTMELVPEFLNVLMDTTLIVKDLLARRKIKKSKKARFSASKKVRKRSLSQEAPSKVGMSGGLDGLGVKPKFPNSATKFYSPPVSYKPASGLTTPMHLPRFKARVPPPKHSPEFTARLYEHGLSSWAQSRTPIQTTTVDIDSTSRPAPTFHDVEVPQNVHNTLAGDKVVLSHEFGKLGMANSDGSGWINPRKSRTGVESRNFELFGSERRDAFQEQESVIMLSDSEEEDYHNVEVDSGILDDEHLLDPRIPRAMEGLPDEPENRFTIRAGHFNDSMLEPWRGNIEVQNMNASMVKDERCRSRLESEAQTSLGCRSKSQKRKDRDDANKDRTDIFDDGKLMQWKEQVVTSGGSLSRDKIKLDAQDFVPTGTAACMKVESEYQSETNAVLQSGDHPSSSNQQSRQWSTWISEAKSKVTSWEAQVQIGNSMTGGSDHVQSQPTKNVVMTSSPCDSDRLVTSLSLMELDRNLDAVDPPHTDSEHLQSSREILNVNLFPSEEKSSEKCPEISDRGGFENPERSHTRESGKSKKGVSSDVLELEKEKVGRELIEGENVVDSVEEPGFESGLHNDTEGMTGAGESVVGTLKLKQEEKSTAIRSLHGQKVPGRKGRPPGAKAKLHLNPIKSVTRGANIYTDGTTQSDKDPRNTNLQRVSHKLRPVGRSKHSNSQGHPSADKDQGQQKVVPDSDCYNFDDDRVKEKIKPNEVWALYHDIDTMPRYLIRVKEVSMSGAFWVKGSWLQSHTASKKIEQQKGTLYSRSCGDFEELKETIIFKVINCFSHRMEFTAKLGKMIQVYPRKDEVWALYSQKDLTLDHFEKAKRGKQNKQHVNNFSNNSRLLVVLSNCEEGRPVDIWVLKKRIGYRTLWEPAYEKGSLPFRSLERFSHRVPAYKLTQEDYPDLNKSDIWDIDAAAVPECQSKVTW